MRVSETLNLAADLIQKRGWVQVDNEIDNDPWGTAGGPVCIEGAIYAAAGVDTAHISVFVNTCPAGLAVREYLNIRDPWKNLFTFNDAEGRTQAEVVEVLRAAAVVEHAREVETAQVPA